MTMSNMSCHEAKRKVYEYLGEELDEKAKQEVDGHLSSCSRCTEEFDLERTISEMVISSNPRLMQSSDFYNRISNSLRSEIE
jgi:anti-sigma factor (TIGR02949 family)